MCRNVTFDYSKLRGKIVEKFRTQGGFARAIHMSDRSMSLKLNNGIGLSQSDIILWCNILDIETKDIPEYFFTEKVSNLKQCNSV